MERNNRARFGFICRVAAPIAPGPVNEHSLTRAAHTIPGESTPARTIAIALFLFHTSWFIISKGFYDIKKYYQSEN